MVIIVKKISKFKANDKNINFPNQFCLGSIPSKFGYVEAEEVSLKGNVYDFSVDYGAIHQSDILNIRKYYSGSFSKCLLDYYYVLADLFLVNTLKDYVTIHLHLI